MPTTTQLYMAFANAACALSWFSCAIITVGAFPQCDEFWSVHRFVTAASVLSTLELVHAYIGLTRSAPGNVALFLGARSFVGLCVAPMEGCSPAYRYTAFIWGCGESVRLGCFAIDQLRTSRAVRSVRYTAGPICFPLGTAGEWTMLIQASLNGRPALWAVVIGWVPGFAVLMKQLLAQRRKHFASKTEAKKL